MNNIHFSIDLSSMLHLKFATVYIKERKKWQRFQQVSSAHKTKHNTIKSVGDTAVYPPVHIRPPPCLCKRILSSAFSPLDQTLHSLSSLAARYGHMPQFWLVGCKGGGRSVLQIVPLKGKGVAVPSHAVTAWCACMMVNQPEQHRLVQPLRNGKIKGQKDHSSLRTPPAQL